MDIRPSSAQQLLIATARDYLRRTHPVSGNFAELGWTGLLVPGDFGGSDGSLLDAVLLVEELGYAGVAGPFVASAVVATTLLAAGGSEAQRKRWLPPLASGERIATLALVEETGTFDPAAVTLTVGNGRLSGRKLFVAHADVADDLIVAVRDGAVVVPGAAPAIARIPLDTLSGAPVFEVTFDGVPVHAEDRIAAPGALAAALQAGALARTAEMVGAAQRILELTVEHARTRVQGGRPIGGHQAIQHACADMVRDVDASRELLHVAAWKASEGDDAAVDVAMAKAYAGDACLAVARRAHQIFGAISYCDEHSLHVFHKRMQAASVDFGDAALHLETVARALGLEA